jgi:hypothetical protein
MRSPCCPAHVGVTFLPLFSMSAFCQQAAKEHKRLLEEHEAKIERLAQSKELFQPRWCERNPEPNLQIGKQYLFRYKQGTYWEEREARSRA